MTKGAFLANLAIAAVFLAFMALGMWKLAELLS